MEPNAVSSHFMVAAYLLYLFVSILLTIWVARTLQRNGAHFLHDAFLGKERLAESVNHLLVVGFYLMNIGYVALSLKEYQTIWTVQEVIELVCGKVGKVMVVLGAMHFFNLYVFNRIRRSSQVRQQPPPVLPREYTRVSPPLPVAERA
ncbi:hypothetical protein JQX13_32825 [Archangium violaceum]|uniref:hypothetical protein n=1 Tax=Archangium violaceum TaxID=83451 RepID=UPI00193C743A|nr:hypothetical protein [Archangium violaceum]QRK04973.1 hypothetical protein JQX13_32825 [Archangium violaceum]